MGEEAEMKTKWPPKDEISTDDIAEEIAELRRRVESIKIPDCIVMNDELFSQMLFRGKIFVNDDKEFVYNGLRVFISSKLDVGQAIVTNHENLQCLFDDEEQEPDNSDPTDLWPSGKPEPKVYHCRICGMRYERKTEAKECQRRHEWQNRRGRR